MIEDIIRDIIRDIVRTEVRAVFREEFNRAFGVEEENPRKETEEINANDYQSKKKAFAKNLRKKREALGLNQTEFAKWLNICGPSNISHWESGRFLPSGKSMEIITRKLETTPRQMMGMTKRQL